MDSFSIECFIAVADSKSFTKAAKKVSRTQSAITQQISKLEKTLQTTLFERGKSIKLTRDGELFLPYALKIYSLNQEALDRFKNPELDGEVRFGVPEDFATLLLSDVLVDFSRAHPRVFLNVECDLTLHLFEKFKEGNLDLALVKMITPDLLPEGVDIWEEPLAWVGTPDAITSLKDNSPIPLVLSPKPCVYRKAALSSLETHDIPSRVVYTSRSYAGIIAAVRANLGLTVLPVTMIPDPLVALSPPTLPRLPELHICLLSRATDNPAISSMKKHLLKILTQQRPTINKRNLTP